MEAILAMWQKHLGIEVELVQTEWATFLQDLKRTPLSDVWRAGLGGRLSRSGELPGRPFHSESIDNNMGYSNPELDRLLEQARTELDQEKRFNLYHRAEEIIVRDAPWIPLWHGDEDYVLVKPNVHDYYLLPLVVPKLRFVYMTEP